MIIKDAIEVTMIVKSDYCSRDLMHDYSLNDIRFYIWKSEINKDYKSEISRIEKMSFFKLKVVQKRDIDQVAEISPSNWQIVTIFEILKSPKVYRSANNSDYTEIQRITNQHKKYLPFVMRVAIEDSIKRNEVIVA